MNDRRPEALRLLLRMVAALVLVFAAVAIASRLFHAEITAAGAWFLDTFGLGGAALGTFLADAFTSPISPQVFMLLGLAAGTPEPQLLSAIAAASLAAGGVGYTIGGRLARLPPLRRRLQSSGVAELLARRAGVAVVLATLGPVPYSLFCYASGAVKLPLRWFAVFLMLRLPRLFVFWLAIKLGFAA